MSRLSVFAGADFIIETKGQKYAYNKGSYIQLEVDSNDDVFIVNHRMTTKEVLSDPKDSESKKEIINAVETKHLRFTRIEDLKFAIDNVLFENQFSPTVDIQESSLSELLLKERVSPDIVTAYLSNTSSVLQKTYTKEGLTIVRIPIRTLATRPTVQEKLRTLLTFEKIDTAKLNPEPITVVSVREKSLANDSGYLVATEAMYGDVDQYLLPLIRDKIKESAPKDWKVRIVDNKVRVSMNGDRPASLVNILETFPIFTTRKSVKTGEDAYYEIALDYKQPELVVESFYTEEVAYPLTEEDDGKQEGDACTTKEGQKGTLKKIGDGMVCMVKESMDPSKFSALTEDDENEQDKVDPKIGTPCSNAEGKKGTYQMVAGKLSCVIDGDLKDSQRRRYREEDEGGKEGDKCSKDGKDGVLKLVDGKLVCEIKESMSSGKSILVRHSTYDLIREEEGSGGNPISDGSPEEEGDPCINEEGAIGTLRSIDGRLVCVVGGSTVLVDPLVPAS